MGKSQPVIERLLSSYETSETGCWLAPLYPSITDGYARVLDGDDGRLKSAHRVSYEHFVGAVPSGLVIDHLCKVRNCVNPAHLEAVTQQENLMRSPTFQARNAAKTHCPKGHEYDYFYVDKRGYPERGCKTCRAANSARKRASYSKSWRQNNAEKVAEFNRKRREQRAAARSVSNTGATESAPKNKGGAI